MRTHDELVIEMLEEDPEFMDAYLKEAFLEKEERIRNKMFLQVMEALNKKYKCFYGFEQ